jgi:hypothetical protein
MSEGILLQAVALIENKLIPVNLKPEEYENIIEQRMDSFPEIQDAPVIIELDQIESFQETGDGNYEFKKGLSIVEGASKVFIVISINREILETFLNGIIFANSIINKENLESEEISLDNSDSHDTIEDQRKD